MYINHDLSYGDILSGQHGARLVKKYFVYLCNNKMAKKEVILKFKTISRTGFVFLIAFMVYE